MSQHNFFDFKSFVYFAFKNHLFGQFISKKTHIFHEISVLQSENSIELVTRHQEMIKKQT